MDSGAGIGHPARVTSLSPESLSDEDRAIIRGCLNATVNGPFFAEWEFHALFGLTRSEVEFVLAKWPDLPDETPTDMTHLQNFKRWRSTMR